MFLRILRRIREGRRRRERINWLVLVLLEVNAVRDHLHVAGNGIVECPVCFHRHEELQRLLGEEK